ncbi:MAG TPA: NADP oxidoreductase [Armatimonadetes bacterium]|nr:NADP oxidoreductase [Armatimonadota bacterium]
MSNKPMIASVWLGGCAGCHMSLLDIDERLLALLELADIGATPITDFKLGGFPQADVGLVEGAVCNTDNIRFLEEIREKSKFLVSFGDCAGWGCVPFMRNFFPLEQVMERGYIFTPSTVDGFIPDDEELPRQLEKVQPIRKFVPVDFHIPGCPPNADTIFYVVSELVQGRVPDSIPQPLLHFD